MKFIVAFFIQFLLCYGITSQSIFIDGNFTDWQSVSPAHTDNSGDQGSSQIDFGDLWIHNDAEFLFLNITIGKELNFQDNNEIEIWIDTDNNPASGLAINGIGADLLYSFGNRTGYIYINGTQSIYHNDIGLVSGPTLSSDRFELAIRRDIIIAGQNLFEGDNIKLLIKDNISGGDIIPDAPESISYSFLDISPTPLLPYSIVKTNEAYLRVLSYNVLFNGLLELPRSTSISRLIKAIQPEIISFQEIYDYSSFQVREKVESILPSASGENWYHAKAGPDVHTISRFPILNTYTIDGNGAFLLDLNEKYGTQLLLIGAHLPCCANNYDRQLEVDAIMAFIRDSKAGTGPLHLQENTPIIILGDMNLVGDAQQLETFLTGNIINESIHGVDFNPDWDETPLEDVHPYTTGLPMSYTWYDEGSSFSPGRLDYTIYTGSNMELINSYALFSRLLPEDSLSAYNISPEDAIFGSDHLPVVSDFKLPGYTDLKDPGFTVKDPFELDIIPNPMGQTATIYFEIPKGDQVQLSVYNSNGKEVSRLYQGYKTKGEYHLDFKSQNLSSGVYFLRLTSGSSTGVRKLIIAP